MVALGRRLGEAAAEGTVIAVMGDLGAGKTVLSRGIARGLGITGRVPSPTYVIVQMLEGGRLPLAHGDLYRLGDEDELEQLGLDELMEGDGVTVLEWADRFADALPADRLDVTITGNDARTIELVALGPRHEALLERLGE